MGKPAAIERRDDARLTREFFYAKAIPEPILGDTWTLRWRYAVAGISQAITVANRRVVLRLKNAAGDVLERRSDRDIGGLPGVKEIGIDADQAAEAVDGDGNPTGGRGWTEWRLRSTAEEFDAWTPFVGTCEFHYFIHNDDGSEITLAKGLFELGATLGARPISLSP
jgi:hypothetical protein